MNKLMPVVVGAMVAPIAAAVGPVLVMVPSLAGSPITVDTFGFDAFCLMAGIVFAMPGSVIFLPAFHAFAGRIDSSAEA